MYLILLIRWLRGSVKFRAEYGPVERLMNLCARHGVPAWDCRRAGTVFIGRTSVRGYRRMHRLARKAGVRTQIIDRSGLPFLLHRYRKRIGILVGALLCALFLLVTQQFVWVVEVQGCKALDPRQLVNALEELGVRRGVAKRAIDQEAVRQQLLLNVEGLSWAALNLRGTTATLLVRERTPPPPKIDTDVPANVVAARDGQIRRLEVLDGRPAVKVGDTVRAGELIVSGVYEDRWGLTHFVRANARVSAHVPETLSVEVPLCREGGRLTGRIVTRRYCELFGMRVPLFLYHTLDGDFKLERRGEQLRAFGADLPARLTTERYIFYEPERQEFSEEAALRLAQRMLAAKEREAFGGAILSRSTSAGCEGGVLTLRGDYSIEVDIAKQVEIPVFDRARDKEDKKEREGGY